jgi:hypothetical protein
MHAYQPRCMRWFATVMICVVRVDDAKGTIGRE